MGMVGLDRGAVPALILAEDFCRGSDDYSSGRRETLGGNGRARRGRNVRKECRLAYSRVSKQEDGYFWRIIVGHPGLCPI
jgi:hypothetical protein